MKTVRWHPCSGITSKEVRYGPSPGGYNCVVSCLASCLFGHAQVERASIIGNVTDSTGAAMPGVEVTVTNEATNTVREAGHRRIRRLYGRQPHSRKLQP